MLDTGGFGPADPALDLVGAWHLLQPGPRQVVRRTLVCDDLEWERGKAWAFAQATGVVWYYVEIDVLPGLKSRESGLGRLTLPGASCFTALCGHVCPSYRRSTGV